MQDLCQPALPLRLQGGFWTLPLEKMCSVCPQTVWSAQRSLTLQGLFTWETGIDVQNSVCCSIAQRDWLERRRDETGWTHPAREGTALCPPVGWQ